jgi:hypothetical protein
MIKLQWDKEFSEDYLTITHSLNLGKMNVAWLFEYKDLEFFGLESHTRFRYSNHLTWHIDFLDSEITELEKAKEFVFNEVRDLLKQFEEH